MSAEYQTQIIVPSENVKPEVHGTRDQSTDPREGQQPNIAKRGSTKSSEKEESLPMAYVAQKGSSALPIINPLGEITPEESDPLKPAAIERAKETGPKDTNELWDTEPQEPTKKEKASAAIDKTIPLKPAAKETGPKDTNELWDTEPQEPTKKEKASAAIDKTMGIIKEKVGAAIGNETMKTNGADQKLKGETLIRERRS